MAFQMIAVIVLFAFAGVFLDKKVSWRIPLFTILLTILGVVAALYSSLKDFIKKDTKKDEDV